MGSPAPGASARRNAPPFRSVYRLLMLFGVATLWPTAIRAADLQPADIRVERKPVSELSQLGDDWQVIPRTEWDQLVKNLQPSGRRPRRVFVERAEYFATFAGEELRGGRFEWQVRNLDRQPAWLDFDNCNLAISRLARLNADSKNAPEAVIWGTTADGRVVARTTSDRDTLSGNWSLRGRTVGRRIRFSVNLIPSTASQLTLRLPDDWQLTSSAGTIAKQSKATNGWTNWVIHASGIHSLNLSLTPPENNGAQQPIRLVNMDTIYVVSDNSLRIQWQTDYEVLHAAVDRVSFRLPSHVKVHSVSYGGNQPLTFSTRSMGNEQRLVVQLPDLLIGRSRAFTIQGIAPVRIGKGWTVPHLTPESAILVDGQVHLRVEKPVVLSGLNLVGLKQTSALTRTPTGEVISFAQEQSDARVQIDTEFPKPDLTCQSVSQLDDQAERMQVTTEIQWTVRRGILYSGRCRIPPGWSVTSVQQPSKTPDGTAQELVWSEVRARLGAKILTIDFPSAIGPDESTSVIIKANRLPGRRRRMRYPVLTPEGVQNLESAVLIVQRDSLGRIPANPQSFWRSRPNEIPQFVKESSLWKSATKQENVTPVVLFSRSLSPQRSFLLDSAESTFDARAWTQATIEKSTLKQHVSIHVEPSRTGIQTLLVHFSQKIHVPIWHFATKPDASPVAIRARRLVATSRPGLVMPKTGELWELTLPNPIVEPFELHGSWTSPLRSGMQPTMVFLPQARRFLGFLECDFPKTANVETTDLFPVADKAAAIAQYSGRKQSSLKLQNGLLYRYRSPDANLLIRVKAADRFAVPAKPDFLELQSVLSFADGSKDGHLASYHFAAEPMHRSFSFELDKPAELVAIQLNGREFIADRQDNRYVIPLLLPNQQHRVTIRYETPSQAAGWLSSAEVLVPHCDGNPAFRWSYAIPPSVRLVNRPALMTTTSAQGSIPWSGRLFGPLGRTLNSPPFNPLSADHWARLLSADSEEQTKPDNRTTPDWAPQGWAVFQANGPVVPQVVTLQVSNDRTARQWSWVMLLATIAIGWSLRRSRFAARRRLAAVWISLCIAAAVSLPDQLAVAAGGCLSGSLIVALLPRRIIRSETPPDQSTTGIPVGSTLSYPRISSISTPALLLCCILGGSASLSGQVGNSRSTSAEKSTPTESQPNVILPASTEINGADPPYVYVQRTLLDSLRKQLAHRVKAIPTVIRAAEYHITKLGSQSADIQASYEVVCVSGDSSVALFLPIEDAHLCDSNACRVNGKPQPVRRHPDGNGFVVDLNRTTGTRTKPTAEEAAVGVTGLLKPEHANREQPESFSVELCLKLPVERVQEVDRLRFGIPRVLSSRLISEDFPQDHNTRIDSLTNAAQTTDWFSRVLRGEIGGVTDLQISWADRESQSRMPVQLVAETNTLVEIQPTTVQIYDHVRYDVSSGIVESLAWKLPSQWILRSLKCSDPKSRLELDVTVNTRSDGAVDIEFQTPRKDPFVITAEILLPLKSRQHAIQIAAPNRHSGPGNKPTMTVQSRSHRIGVATAGEFQLDVAPIAVAAATNLEPQERDQFRSLFPNRRSPEFAFALASPTSLKAGWSPKPVNRVVEATQTGFVQRDLLAWTLAANVTTNSAPVYQHEIDVDPRLRINAVSVIEDEAPRLVRWSRNGNRLLLFLSGKASRTQRVLVQGEMPLRFHTRVRLPFMTFRSADVKSSRSLLFRDAAVSVEIDGLPPGNRLAVRDKPPTANALPVTAFLDEDNTSRPFIQASERTTTLQAERFTIIRRASKDARMIRMNVNLLFDDSLPASAYVVSIPAELVDSLRFNSALWTVQANDQPDGSSDWLFQPKEPNGKVPDLELLAHWIPATGANWAIPLPKPRNATLRTDILAVSDDRNRLQPDAPAEQLPPDEQPERKPTATLPAGTTFYRSRESLWRLSDASSEQSTRQPRIPLMETRVWFDDDRQFGQTHLYTVGLGRKPLQLQWPATIRVESVDVDGAPIQVSPDADDDLIVPLTNASTNLVRINWSREVEPGFSAFIRRTADLPCPRNVVIENAMFACVPRPGGVAKAFHGIQKLDNLQFTIMRIEQLLQIASLPNTDDPAVASSFRTASESFDSLNQRLEQNPEQRAGIGVKNEEKLADLDDRIELLRTRFQAPVFLQLIDPDQNELTSFTSTPAEAVVGRVDTDSQEVTVTYWHIASPLIGLLIGIGIMAMAIPISRQFFRVHVGDRLAGWEPLSWAALGIIWWLWLAPSLLGLVLMVIAAGKAGREWYLRHGAGRVVRVYNAGNSR